MLAANLLLRRRSARVRRLPWGLQLLPALALVCGALNLAGQRWGLVGLMAELILVCLGLRLFEVQVVRWLLPPEQVAVLVGRIQGALFFLGVGLLVLAALDSLQTVADLPLGMWLDSAIHSAIELGQLGWVSTVLCRVVEGSARPAAWLSWLASRGLLLSDGGRRAPELVIRYVLVALVILWGLSELGINQTGVLAVAGGLSVGLGFGIKEVVSNFNSGLWLLLEGSVRPGEVLMHEGEACEVRRPGLRATTLWRGSDNAELMVPNQIFFTHTTTTYTRSDRTRRCRLEIQTAAAWPPDPVIALLVEIAAAEPQMLPQPPPTARLIAFGPEMNRYGISFTIADPLMSSRITAGLLLEVWNSFAARGILTAPAPDDGDVPSGEGGA